MAELTHDAARELGVRIISPDRPGIRGFELPGRPPAGRLAAVADARWPIISRSTRFRMFAISGGAPYAYASAWMMPERVEKIAVASGAPPIAELPDRGGLLRLYSRMLELA